MAIEGPGAAFPRLTDRLPLGNSGLQVSPFALGMVGDPAVVEAAFAAGINLFFISVDLHWRLYEATRQGVARVLASNPGARDAMVVAAVSYVAQPEFLWSPFEELLDEVPRLGHLDVTVAGGCYGADVGTRAPVYRKHRETRWRGTRAIGASFHDRAAGLQALQDEAFDLVFVRYNPVHPDARQEIFEVIGPRARGRRALLFNFKSTRGWFSEPEYEKHKLGPDYWRPAITDYYRFALSQPALDGILCSLPSVEAVAELEEALARGPLDDDDCRYLLQLGKLVRGAARVT
jgi:hypothetical protein